MAESGASLKPGWLRFIIPGGMLCACVRGGTPRFKVRAGTFDRCPGQPPHLEHVDWPLPPSDHEFLLQALNDQARKSAGWPPMIWATALLLASSAAYGLNHSALPEAFRASSMLGLVLCLFVGWWRQALSHRAVIFFEPDAARAQDYGALVRGARRAAESRRLHWIAPLPEGNDPLHTTGWDSDQLPLPAQCYVGQAPGVQANMEVPCIRTKHTLLAFYPDQLLEFHPGSVRAVAYECLHIEHGSVSVTEYGTLPHDARLIGSRWPRAAGGGKPDQASRRQRKLPVCAYASLILSSDSGLRVHLVSSRESAFDELVAGLRHIGSAHLNAGQHLEARSQVTPSGRGIPMRRRSAENSSDPSQRCTGYPIQRHVAATKRPGQPQE